VHQVGPPARVFQQAGSFVRHQAALLNSRGQAVSQTLELSMSRSIMCVTDNEDSQLYAPDVLAGQDRVHVIDLRASSIAPTWSGELGDLPPKSIILGAVE
jgi:hypothetical protein